MKGTTCAAGAEKGTTQPGSSPLHTLASLAALVELDPVGVGRQLYALACHDPRIVKGLLAFASIQDEDLAAYMTTQPDRLIRMSAGEIWLTTGPRPDWTDLWVSIDRMRAMGQAVAGVIAGDDWDDGFSSGPEMPNATSHDWGD